MFNKLLIALCLIGGLGCSRPVPAHSPAGMEGHQKEAVDMPTLPGAVEARADLPNDWKEIAQDNWSFGVPNKFFKLDNLKDSKILATYGDPDQLLLIGFGVEDSNDDLKTYSDNFAEMMTSLGPKLIKMQKGEKLHGRETMLLLFAMSPGVAAIKTIIVDGKKAYNLNCTFAMSQVRENLPVCGAVAKSLIIK